MSQDKNWLENLTSQANHFLQDKLRLNLHPDKVYIKTLASGVDFLGWVHFPDHRVLRTTTKYRMLNKLIGELKPETVQAYLGMLKWGNTASLVKIDLGL